MLRSIQMWTGLLWIYYSHELEMALRCVTSQNPSSWSTQLSWIKRTQNSLTFSATVLSSFEASIGYLPSRFPSRLTSSCPPTPNRPPGSSTYPSTLPFYIVSSGALLKWYIVCGKEKQQSTGFIMLLFVKWNMGHVLMVLGVSQCFLFKFSSFSCVAKNWLL